MAVLQNNMVYSGNPIDEGPPMPPATLQNSQYVAGAVGHTLYKVACQYFLSSGLSVVPVAGGLRTIEGTSIQRACQAPVVRMQTPSQEKYVWWVARNEAGELPVCPYPQSTENEPFLKGWITFAGPALDQAGSEQRVFEIHGCYRYGVAQPRDLSDGLFLPVPIVDAVPFGAWQLSPINFTTGVFGFGPNPPTPYFPNTGIPPPLGWISQGTATGDEGLFD